MGEKEHCNSAGQSRVVRWSKEDLKISHDKKMEDLDHATKNAKVLAERGQLDTSKALEDRAKKLEEEIEQLREENKVQSKGDFVCECCGIRCSLDEDRQYEGHMESNLHLAYSRCREKQKELKEKMRNYVPDENKEDDKADDKDKDRDRDRDKDRDKDRGNRD